MSSLRQSWPWLVAAVGFAAYPLVRPYADETALPGLAAMATDRWVLAHLLGMVAFAVLPVAVSRLDAASRTTRALTYLGVVLVLPYYGGEAFALPAIGRRAVATGDLSLLGLVDGFRYQPAAVTLFGVGLVALAVAGVLLARQALHRPGRVRAAGLLVGLDLVLYLPQFFTPGPVRIAHGLALGLGCALFALALPRVVRSESGPGPTQS